MLRDNLVMFIGFFEEFKNTGTAFNSSRWAARALTNPVRYGNGPKNILEVGAGTGPVTSEIIKDMSSKDTLTIVEINPKFMAVLKERVKKLPEYELHKDRITFFEGPIQEVPEDDQYDVIVCALPFLNFERKLVEEIFAKLSRLGTESTVMTYYEYIGLRQLGKVVSKTRKERVEELERFFHDIGHRRLITKKKVWLNVLPIYIYTMKLPSLRQSDTLAA